MDGEELPVENNKNSYLDVRPTSKISLQNYSTARTTDPRHEDQPTKEGLTTQNCYSDLLVTAADPSLLIEKFLSERCELQRSATSDTNFELENCIKRSKEGYYVYKYSSFKPRRTAVLFRIFPEYIWWKSERGTVRRIGNKHLKGFMIGASSSTFLHFKEKTEKKLLEKLGFFDCFSIMMDRRSVDLATFNDVARYDIIISLSWIISSSSSLPCCVPIKKSKLYLAQLSFYYLRQKLRREAEQRHISIPELFMLGMAKYCFSINYRYGYKKIYKILHKRFTLTGKFYTMMKQLARNFPRNQVGKHTDRIRILNYKRIYYFSSAKKKGIQTRLVLTDSSERQKHLVSVFTPGLKSLFQCARSDECFVAELRNNIPVQTKIESPEQTVITNSS